MTQKLPKVGSVPDHQPISQMGMLLPKEWEACQRMAETDPSDYSKLSGTPSVSLPRRSETDREHSTAWSWESICISREVFADTDDHPIKILMMEPSKAEGKQSRRERRK